MFFYLTGATIIFGAEVNAALDQRNRTTRRRRTRRASEGTHGGRTEEAPAHPAGRRRRRVLLALATGLVGYAMRDGIEFFRSPSQLASASARREASASGSAASSRTARWSAAKAQRCASPSPTAARDRAGRLRRHPAGSVPRGSGRHRHRRLEGEAFVASEVLASHDEKLHAEGSGRGAQGAGRVPSGGRQTRELTPSRPGPAIRGSSNGPLGGGVASVRVVPSPRCCAGRVRRRSVRSSHAAAARRPAADQFNFSGFVPASNRSQTTSSGACTCTRSRASRRISCAARGDT